MKLKVYLLTYQPTTSKGYIKRMIVIDYNVQNVMRKYDAYNIEEIGIYTGKEKEPCVICKEIVNF